MTNRETSLNIRRELKESGYNTRDFRISVKDSGYNTVIKIIIKNPHINRKDIKSLLIKYEQIDRDERSGEILDGCNTYLFISYEYGVFNEVSQTWASTAKGIMLDKSEVIRIFDDLNLINLVNRLEIRQRNKNSNCSYLVSSFNELCEFLYKFAEFGSIDV